MSKAPIRQGADVRYLFRFWKRGDTPEETEKMERLEAAEQELEDLKARSTVAITYLRERQSRNHWRESIEKMIQGGAR